LLHTYSDMGGRFTRSGQGMKDHPNPKYPTGIHPGDTARMKYTSIYVYKYIHVHMKYVPLHTWAYRLGVCAYGSMGVWEYGRMGVWAYRLGAHGDHRRAESVSFERLECVSLFDMHS